MDFRFIILSLYELIELPPAVGIRGSQASKAPSTCILLSLAEVELLFECIMMALLQHRHIFVTCNT